MNETYYEHGTAAERWARAQLFFDAKEYAHGRPHPGRAGRARRPSSSAPRLLLARAYYHSAQLSPRRAELRAILERWPGGGLRAADARPHPGAPGPAAEAATHLRMAAAFEGDFGPREG